MIDNYDFDIDYLKYLKKFKSFKDYSNIIDNLYKILNSEEYKKFVSNISNLFVKLNIINPLEVAVLYNDLLFDGFFLKANSLIKLYK